MAFNPGHARRMRNALAGSGRVVQIGMQMNSGDGIQKVRELVNVREPGHAHAARDAPLSQCAVRRLAPRDPARLQPGPRRLAGIRGRGEARPVRPPALHQLAVLLGLLGRQRVREHGAHARLLVRRPRPLDPPFRDDDRRQLPVTPDAGAGHVPGLDEPRGEASASRSPRCSATTTTARGTIYLFGTKATLVHTPSDQVQRDPARGEERGSRRPGRRGLQGVHRSAHAELLRLRPQSERAGLPASSSASAPRSPARWPIDSYRRGTTVRWDSGTEEIL